jgi:hypothetical protein
VEHADFQSGVSRQIFGMLRGNVRISQRTTHNRDMQSRRRAGNQSFSGSTGIGAFFGGLDADAGASGGAAVITSEFICALLSGVVAAGFTVAAAPVAAEVVAAGGVTAGAGVTTPGSVLMLAGGKAGGNGVAAG